MKLNLNLNLRFFTKPLFSLINLCMCFLLVNTLSIYGQLSNKQVRLSITDEIGKKINKIDTLLPPGADVDAVLLKMGYDAESVAKAYIGNNARRITVKTEEIIPRNMQQQLLPTPKTTTITRSTTTPTTNGTNNLQPTTTNENTWGDAAFKEKDLDIEAIMNNLPPNAIVEEMPDGKKITTITTHANGETETKELIIKTTRNTAQGKGSMPIWNSNNPKNDRQPVIIDNPTNVENLSNENEILSETQLMPQTTKTYQPIPEPFTPQSHNGNNNNNNTTTTYSSQNFGKYTNAAQLPNLQVAVADLDMFDNSTLNSQNPTILNYAPLAVSNFLVKPDFQQGYYQFSFNLPINTAPETAANVYIYDAVGYLIYSESFTGEAYKKYLPEFHLYKKGTFLVLITQNSQKYTQKITFE